MNCKVKINVGICGESALDAVSKLVADGTIVNKACKQVAEDFNIKNEGATVKSNTLRHAYIRAQKVVTCNNITKVKKITTPPVVDNTKAEELMVILLEMDKENHALKEEIVVLKAQLKKEGTNLKEPKTHEEERAEFLDKRREVKKEASAYFQRRLKEDGIA
jgi:hypothetical protein